MAPLAGLPLAALITTGGGLLEALFSPSEKKKLKWQTDAMKGMEGWRAGQIESRLKPKTPYYQSGNLPQLGATSMQAVMGNLMQRLGPETLAKWGINPQAQQAPRVPQQMPPQQAPMLPGPMPGGPQATGGFPGQELLLRKYGRA